MKDFSRCVAGYTYIYTRLKDGYLFNQHVNDFVLIVFSNQPTLYGEASAWSLKRVSVRGSTGGVGYW